MNSPEILSERDNKKVRRIFVAVVFLIISIFSERTLQSQTADGSHAKSDSVRISYPKLYAFGGIVLAGGIAVHFTRYEPLWKEHFAPFKFREDLSYAKNQDKLLHFFGGTVGSRESARAFESIGYKERESVLYGAIISLSFLTFMKIEDGYIDYLGFDRVDELANLLGSGYPLAQSYFPSLRSFTPKASYVASGNQVVAREQSLPGFLEDHQGQKFWMGITVHDLLPERVRYLWPSILGIAVGYTVRELNTPRPYHETIIALDLDLRKMPGDSPFLRTVWETLNYIHLPMPAIRISPSVVWYGLYF